MPIEYDVFISYNHIDIAFAEQLEARVSSRAVFRDKTKLRLGDGWIPGLLTALYSSRHVVALLSPDYFRSSMCRAEIYHALLRDPDATQKIVLPIVVRKTELPDALRLVQYVTATNPSDWESAVEQVIEVIRDTPNTATVVFGRTPPAINDERLNAIAELRPDVESFVKVIRMARRVLENLDFRSAGYTSLTMPPALQIEAEDKRREVAALEDRLRGLLE
jgi:hypothetical protein